MPVHAEKQDQHLPITQYKTNAASSQLMSFVPPAPFMSIQQKGAALQTFSRPDEIDTSFMNMKEGQPVQRMAFMPPHPVQKKNDPCEDCDSFRFLIDNELKTLQPPERLDTDLVT